MLSLACIEKKKDPGLPKLGHLKQKKIKKDEARAKVNGQVDHHGTCPI